MLVNGRKCAGVAGAVGGFASAGVCNEKCDVPS